MLVGLKEKGLPAVALDNRPELVPRLQWAYRQFSALTRERVYAHDTPLPLRLSDIDLYWKRFVGFLYDDFYDQIVLIDNVYLKQLELYKKKREGNKKVGVKKPAR